MRITPAKWQISILGLFASEPVYAQHVPLPYVLFAVSPFAVFLLIAFLAILKRSWQTGIRHAGLLLVWIVLFVLAAQLIENDYVNWAPIVLYVAHALLITVLVVIAIARRNGKTST